MRRRQQGALIAVIATSIAGAGVAHAQHEHTAGAGAQDDHAMDDHAMDDHAMDDHAMDNHAMDDHAMDDHAMAMTGVLGIPMARTGSGTAWLPDASPVRGRHLRAGGWMVMLHGNAFVGYDAQGGDTGDDALVSQNWLMAMADHGLGGGAFHARAMLSLEPLTVGDRGYPLLLQTGETAGGMPLVDRQHAHDLFMELATAYERPVAGPVAFQLYAALAGEPALGPVAFPHRPSAMADPLAPLGHHWEDSTHISFGVLTAGLFTRAVKLEGSWFNGREPDEDRTDLDLRGLDSGSVRLSVAPSPAWALQASYGRLASPEARAPDVSVQRATASAIHARPIGLRGAWTSTVTWGRNLPSSGPDTDALLGETALELGRLGTTFARAEYVMKSGEDLALPAMADRELAIAAFSLGHVQPLITGGGVETAVGVAGTVDVVDPVLADRYGTRAPLGAMVYVQIQPTRIDSGR